MIAHLPRTTTAAVIMAVIGSGCVGRAADYSTYEDKAAQAAGSGLSASRTASLAATLFVMRKGLAPYVDVTISQSEEEIRAIEGSFASIQPPDRRSLRLRSVLEPLLEEAVRLISLMRIQARWRTPSALASSVRNLEAVARSFQRFIDRHA